MNVFLFAANAVAPIVLLMLVGYFLKVKKVFDESFFRLVNKFVFHICIPVMLFFNVYEVEKLEDIHWTAVIFSAVILLFLFVLGFFVVMFIKDKRQKGVVWQSFFRANTAIIGIPLAVSLGGKETLPVVSILAALCVIIVNVLAVISLSLYIDDGKKTSVWNTIKKIVSNPLLIAIALGLVVVAIRNVLPQNTAGMPVFTIKENMPFLYKTLEMLSQMTTPLSLIVLGGLFSFSAIKELKKQIIIGTLARIVISPLLAIGIAIACNDFLHFGPPEFAALVSIFCPPAAVSGLAMAAEMKNDERLAGQIVVWTTVFSVFTIYITTVILKFFGII